MSIRIPIRVMVAGAALLLAGASLQAQTNYSYQKSTGKMTVGAWVEGGISFPTDIDENYSPEFGFAFRPSATITYPFTPSVFGTLSLGLDSRSGIQRNADDNNIRSGVKLSYFSIFPAVRFSAFVVGVNIGMPMSGTMLSEGVGSVGDFETDVETMGGKLNTMIEPRIGAILTLMDEQTGWLGLSIMAGYPISNLIEFPDFTFSGGGITIEADTKEVHIPTVQLGLTYQFAIPGTGL